MKSDTVTSTTLAYIALVLMLPISAPANPVVAQINTPVAKMKRELPAAPQMNIPVARKVDAPPLAVRAFATQAPEEACVYDDNYSMGANNNGTTFCSKNLAYQDLPSERQGRISAADVPEGYVLVLYAGPGQSGATCRLVGRNAGLATSCDNMARGMLLEPNVGAAQAAQQDNANRRARETHAEAVAAGDIWAAGIKEQQEAAAAANEARAAEEREAFARMQTRDREEARARDAAAAEEAQRQQAAAARAATAALELASFVAASNGCLVIMSESDLSVAGVFGGSDFACINEDTAYVGNEMNDDVEHIDFNNRRIQITAYEHDNFQGRSIKLTCGSYELRGDPEDTISSVKIEILPIQKPCLAGGREQTKSNWDR